MKCVRFESGEVGVVDKHGTVVLKYDRMKHAEFADHDFVKLRSSMVEVTQNKELRYMLREENSSCMHIFYVDLKSGQMFGSMPKLHRYGDFEVAFLCDNLFTRTKKCYTTETDPSFVWRAKNGLYLKFSYNGTLETDVVKKMIYRYCKYDKCQIKGDESDVYWLMVEFDRHPKVINYRGMEMSTADGDTFFPRISSKWIDGPSGFTYRHRPVMRKRGFVELLCDGEVVYIQNIRDERFMPYRNWEIRADELMIINKAGADLEIKKM